jgi:polyisoprenoid-binding protein YceI
LTNRLAAPFALLVGLCITTQLAAQKAPAAAPKGATTAYDVAPIGNEARYVIMEELFSIGTNKVVGKTKDVKGRIVVDQNGAIVKDSSKITINAQTLQTDQKRRDNSLKTQTLETNTYPEVTLVPVQFEDASADFAAGQEKSFTLVADLTVRNVTESTKWAVVAHRQGADIVGTASTAFALEYFNIKKPVVAMVRSTADSVRLEYDFHFTSPPAPVVVK